MVCINLFLCINQSHIGHHDRFANITMSFVITMKCWRLNYNQNTTTSSKYTDSLKYIYIKVTNILHLGKIDIGLPDKNRYERRQRTEASLYVFPYRNLQYTHIKLWRNTPARYQCVTDFDTTRLKRYAKHLFYGHVNPIHYSGKLLSSIVWKNSSIVNN